MCLRIAFQISFFVSTETNPETGAQVIEKR